MEQNRKLGDQTWIGENRIWKGSPVNHWAVDGSLVEGIQTSDDVGTELNPWELPGSVVVRTLHLHCRGPEFKPWSRNLDPTSPVTLPKKKKKKCLKELNLHLFNIQSGTSLVVQWLRIHFAMQGVWVKSLIGELRFCVLKLRPNTAKQINKFLNIYIYTEYNLLLYVKDKAIILEDNIGDIFMI